MFILDLTHTKKAPEYWTKANELFGNNNYEKAILELKEAIISEADEIGHST